MKTGTGQWTEVGAQSAEHAKTFTPRLLRQDFYAASRLQA